jgi:hypothetical protein
MNTRIACALAAAWAALWAPSLSRAAYLQTRDLLFISTHKSPTQVVGDSKMAYLLTEGGILCYDYRRSAWVDNLNVGRPFQAIRYSPSRSKLYALVEGGALLEYNPAFRRFTDATLDDWNAAAGGGQAADLNGLILTDNDFFLGDAIRDKYMRRAPITQAKVFDYDNLWVLTDGLGPYYGSLRRKQASSFRFGLDFPAATVITAEDGQLWFGSCPADYGAVGGSGVAAQSNGSLVKAKADLTGWKAYPAQLESGFGDGCIRDVKGWKDYVWLATDKGIVRHDPRTGLFRTYRHLMGSVDVRVNFLHVHEGKLYAATERGVCYLESPDKEEILTLGELPVPGGVQVYELASKDKDLWAATRYGLQVFQNGAWKSLNAVSTKDVPEASNVPNLSVAYHDTTLYWIYENRVMAKPRKQLPKVLLERNAPFQLRFDGDILYVAYADGVAAYDVRKRLWNDFRLVDGIPGTKITCVAVADAFLYIGTDAGVERIALRPYLP